MLGGFFSFLVLAGLIVGGIYIYMTYGVLYAILWAIMSAVILK